MDFNTLLTNPRHTSSGYHISVARIWLSKGITNKENTPLVYSSFEFRCAIERVLMELYILMKMENIVEDDLLSIGSFSSLVKIVHEAGGGNRILLNKLLTFNSILSEYAGLPLTLSIPNVGKLHNYWSNLSRYCHRQIQPDSTWNSTEWVNKGYVLLEEVNQYLKDILEDHFFGSFSSSGHPPEVNDLKDKYMSDEIDENQLRKRLEIMQPVLLRRRLFN